MNNRDNLTDEGKDLKKIYGKAYIDGKLIEACIEFDEIIRNITKECKGKFHKVEGIILPSTLDVHVHFRGLNQKYKETPLTGSMEAVAGGITAIIDMPNTDPKCNRIEIIMEKLGELKDSYVDYSMWAGVPDMKEEIDRIERLNLPGFKVYPEDLEKAEQIMKLKGKVILHPEMPNSINMPRKLRDIHLELSAIRYISNLHRNVHVTHITNYYSLILSRDYGFTTDVPPHYFILEERNCLTKVNPPLRDKMEKYNLIKALYEVDLISSDHAPHSPQEKNYNYLICPPGIANVSFTLPFLMTLFHRNIISLERVVELISRNPWRLIGKEMEIKVNKRANLSIVRKRQWKYKLRYSKAVSSPLDGYPLEYEVEMTIVGGAIAYSEGEIIERNAVFINY
jgi:dihydroorotase